MANKVALSVKEFLAPHIESLGVDIVEVEYKKLPSGMNMTIFIDSPQGIDLNKCEEVHHLVDVLLDELDPTNGSPYTLNVSSVGLDYPLKTDADLNRNLGQHLEVNLYSKLDGKKEYDGKLISFNKDEITIIANGNEKTFLRSQISKLTKYISF